MRESASGDFAKQPVAKGRRRRIAARAGVERLRLAADHTVFQVGPLLSPRAEKLLFAQVDGDRSGEIFLSSLVAGSREDWPPKC